jgi:hypothetical protein
LAVDFHLIRFRAWPLVRLSECIIFFITNRVHQFGLWRYLIQVVPLPRLVCSLHVSTNSFVTTATAGSTWWVIISTCMQYMTGFKKMFGDRGQNNKSHQDWRKCFICSPSEIVWKVLPYLGWQKKKKSGITTISELLHRVRKSPMRGHWATQAQASNKQAGGPIRAATKLMWTDIWTLDYTWGSRPACSTPRTLMQVWFSSPNIWKPDCWKKSTSVKLHFPP